jgi:hypothetical protein
MPYRFNGVECDTVEELRALTGYPMNQVLASNKESVANTFVPGVTTVTINTCKECGCYSPYHRPGCEGPK